MFMQCRQQGGSAIGLIITLAILAYGAYVGIQYVPMHIQSSTAAKVLDTVAKMHGNERFSDATAVRIALDKQLYINGMDDMKDRFDVMANGGSYTITVSYERELNLLVTRQSMPFRKSITLK